MNAPAVKYLAISGLITTVVSFISWPIIARVNGPEIIAHYNYYLSLVAISCPVLTLMRERIISTSNSVTEKVIETNVFFTHLPIALVIFLLAFFVFFNVSDVPFSINIPILVCLLLANAVLIIYKSSIINLKKFLALAVLNVAQPITFLVFFYIIYLVNDKVVGVGGLIASYLSASWLMLAAIHFKNTLPAHCTFRVKIFSSLSKSVHTAKLVKYVAPAGLLDALTANLPFVLLVTELGEVEAAYFALILRFFMMPQNVISRIVQPIILRFFSENKSGNLKLKSSNQLFFFIAGIALFYLISAIAFLEYFWKLLGDGWSYNQGYIIYIGVIASLQFISGLFSVLLISIRALKISSFMQALNFIITLGLFLVFDFKNLQDFLIVLLVKEILFRFAYLLTTKYVTTQKWVL